jgi:Pentapeptide repeats (8 copies)
MIAMANPEHLEILKQGVEVWNAWRRNEPSLVPDLAGAALRKANLEDADLKAANLSKVDLTGANLNLANFTGANLSYAVLDDAQLDSAQLDWADLRDASLKRANLMGAHLPHADLRRANLRLTNLIDADLTDADLTGCLVFGTSAWNLKLSGTKQRDLVITEFDDPSAVTVDNIEVAQFVYLLLHNEKIRNVIDTVGKKGVLLLGRFTEGRIAVLDRLRDELRQRGYLPIVFNFDKPETKDFTETVRLLAGLSSPTSQIRNQRPSNCKRRCRRSWFRSAPSSRKARSRSPCCRTCGVSIANGCSSRFTTPQSTL